MEGLLFRKRAPLFTLFAALVFVILISQSLANLFKRTTRSAEVTGKKLFDTKGREFAYKSIRIPKDIRPLHYDLFLHPNLTSLEYDGKVKVLLKCFRTTNRIIFHKKGLKTQRVKVTDKRNAEIKVTDISENKERSLVILKLDKELSKDEEYTLSMDFSGKLAGNMEGFYKSEYTTKSGEKRSGNYCLNRFN